MEVSEIGGNQLLQANHFQEYLQVVFLSEIATGDNKEITILTWNGYKENFPKAALYMENPEEAIIVILSNIESLAT